MTEPTPAAELSPDQRRFRWTLGAVAALSVAELAAYALLHRDGSAAIVVASIAVFLSKLFIFGGAIEIWPFDKTTLDFTSWELAMISWTLDLWVACGLLAGIQRFEKLPLVGRAMAEARARASQTLIELPGLRRLAVSGIMLLVFLPIPGSGAVTGTLIGRIVGLSRMATFAAVAVGAGVAVSTYAGVATFLGENWREMLESPTLVIASFVGLVVFLWLAWLRVRRELTRA